MGLRFFADHCISNYIIEALREAGHEVFRLRDYMPQESNDLAVISKAQDSIFVSLNGDFSDIVTYPPSKYKGIIAFQVRNHPETIPQALAQLQGYLYSFPNPSDYQGRLFLVEAHRIRIRE